MSVGRVRAHRKFYDAVRFNHEPLADYEYLTRLAQYALARLTSS